MVRVSRWLIAKVVALALDGECSCRCRPRVVCYQPAPVAVAPVTSYYAPVTVTMPRPSSPPTTRPGAALSRPTICTRSGRHIVLCRPPAMTTYRYGPSGGSERQELLRPRYTPAPRCRTDCGSYYP